MIYEIITGSAFQVDEPMDGNVRNYTASDGTHWVGHDTHDVIYACSTSCADKALAEFGIDGVFAGSHVRLDTVQRTHDETGMRVGSLTYANTVECCHADDYWPDYTVACGGCGEILHERSEE